jgi:CheY-like chemotaxis protein
MMKAKVLVVDDEPGWQEIIKMALMGEGYSVYVADNYRQAEAVLQKEVFHLAIIDIRLDPGGQTVSTGMDLLECIIELETELPYCIVLTGYPTVESARDSFKKYRVWDFITKLDFDHQTFLKTVAEAVDQAVKRDISTGLDVRWEGFRNALRTSSSQACMTAMTELVAYISQALGLPKPGLPMQRYKRLLFSQIKTAPIFANTAIPHPTLLIALHGHELMEDDLDDLHYILAHALPHPTYVALILIADEEQIQEALPLLERARQTYSYDIIPLDRQDIMRILTVKDPPRRFRQLVFSQVSLIAVSPFVITGPVLDTMFFGREHELREMTEHVDMTNYALIGGRRIGKTSILKRLERIRLPSAGFRALYHDCSFTPTQAELAQAMVADRTWFPEPPASASASFARIIQALPDDKPLVILLDEADKLIEPDQAAGYPLFNTLRALANRGRCRFVLSGEQALRTELTNPNSPFYNFANEMLIGRLDFCAVEELITRPMRQLEIELTNEAEIVRRVWDFTSGHPNVVQRLCQRLIVRLNQRGDRRLTLDDVEVVVADPDFLRKDFLNIYWERATALERLCSLVMAADNDVRTLTAVHDALTSRGIEVTLNQVDDALERLVDLRNILKRTAEGYDFAVTAFWKVIAKTARLDDLIALNCETYRHHGDV